MKVLVTAFPTIDGVKRSPGEEVEVNDTHAAMLIRDGLVRPAGTPEPIAGTAVPAATGGTGTPAEDLAPANRPGRGASKDEMVAYAVARGMSRDEADTMTRAQLTAHLAGS